MFDKTQPLWMPPGSVRSILALALTGVTCVMALQAQISGETFLTIQATVVAFYFGTKSGATLPEQANPPSEPPAS